MTLILTAATHHIAAQVADTRLTRLDGSLFDDNAVKTVLVRCTNAVVSISYTGVAFIEGKRVDEWVARRLVAHPAKSMSFDDLLTFLLAELNAVLKRDLLLANSSWGLELVFAGLGIKDSGLRASTVVVITNATEPNDLRGEFTRFDARRHPFVRYMRTGNLKHFVSMFGAVDEQAPLRTYAKQLRKQIRKAGESLKAEQLLDSLAAILRELRRRPEFEQVIGHNCVAIAVLKNFSVRGRYYGPTGVTLLQPIRVNKGLSTAPNSVQMSVTRRKLTQTGAR